MTALSASACGSGSDTNQAGNGDLVDGGGQSGAAGAGGSGAGGVGGGTTATCLPAADPTDGSVIRAATLTDIGDVNDTDASCDGSFVVTGRSSAKTSFARRDHTTIDLADAPLWIARNDRDGYALWAKAIPTGYIGAAQPSWVKAFPDGSAVLCGMYGTDVTFGAGEAHEAKFTASQAPHGYIARYAADGTLTWALKLADTDDNYAFGVGAGPNGVTYAVVANSFPGGLKLAPGDLDLQIGQNEGAVVAISADGRFLHASRYATPVVEEMRLTTLATGGVMVTGTSYSDLVLAKGTPKAASLPPDDYVFYARFTTDLALDAVHGLPVASNAYGSAGFPDGSVAFVGSFQNSVTLGAGDPGSVTFTNSGQVSGSYVARFNPDGHIEWAAELAGDYDVDVTAATSTSDGSVWVAGSYALGASSVQTSNLVLAPGTPGALTFSASGTIQFVARFDPSGKPLWVVPFLGTPLVDIRAIAASPVSLASVGNFGGTGHFGSPSTDLTTGDKGIFLALLGP